MMPDKATAIHDGRRRPAPMKVKLFGCLVLFTAIVIMILWVFQVFLLERIYRAVQLAQLNYSADMIADNADGAELQTLCNRVAQQRSFCISVWRIHNTKGAIVASSHIREDCLVHNFSGYDVGKLYAKTQADGGTSVEYISLAAFRNRDYSIDNYGGGAPGEDTGLSDSIFVSRIVGMADGDEMFIVLNSTINPDPIIIMTLSQQLAIITFILLTVALILALVLAGRLSAPLTRMTVSAKALAGGDYGVRFCGDGCRETEELGETLNYAAVELGSLDRLQKELIANISHDLRTPLTMIRGYGELMRDIPDEMTPENMQVIIDETVRLSELVSDIMDISKLDSGEQQISSERFDLASTVRETLTRYEKLTERDGYTISCEIADGEYAVTADRTRVLQVLYNLVSNAINYTGADKRVSVRLFPTEHDGAAYARVEVADDGEGISAENLPYIWDRYYRIDRVHKRAAVGTGLGLSIVKSVLTLHGAPFGVTSAPGEGSVFWFELKLTRGEGERDN